MPGPDASLARLPSFVLDLTRFAVLVSIPLSELLSRAVPVGRHGELLAMQQRMVGLGRQVGLIPPS
jgi:hypothetical protein